LLLGRLPVIGKQIGGYVMSVQNKRITRQLLADVFEHGRLEAVDELVHLGFVNHEAPDGSPQGPEVSSRP
jgi:hypothetical protein